MALRFNWQGAYSLMVTTGLVGILAGGIISGLGNIYDSGEKEQDRLATQRIERCRNAFSYLEDEAPNPDLTIERRNALAEKQARIAIIC